MPARKIKLLLQGKAFFRDIGLIVSLLAIRQSRIGPFFCLLQMALSDRHFTLHTLVNDIPFKYQS